MTLLLLRNDIPAPAEAVTLRRPLTRGTGNILQKKILCSFYNIAGIVATASGGPAGKRAPKHAPRKKVPTKKAGGCSKIQQPSACRKASREAIPKIISRAPKDPLGTRKKCREKLLSARLRLTARRASS